MQTKTKNIIIALILLVSVIVILFIIDVKKNINQPARDINVQKEVAKMDQNTAEEKPEVKLIYLEAKILKVEKSAMIVEGDGVKNAFPLNENVSVYASNSGDSEKKTSADLKDGDNVKIGIDQKTTNVVSIEILNK